MMANRYGRKQRKKHREEIAYLKGRLYRESTHHMYLPGESIPDLESVAEVIDYRTSEEGSQYGMVERNAYITVGAPSDELLAMLYDQRKVQFRGTQYLVAKGNYSPSIYHGEEQTIEIELMGVV